jgi:peptidoglycan/LPS O-acetylase OafA/YrhL
MSHAFVEAGVSSVFKHILKRPEMLTSNGSYILELSTIDTVVACAVIVVSVLAISQLTYNLLEKPFREKSRRIAFSKLK